MRRIPLSSAAATLLRALIARAGVPRDRILLIDAQSTDWRSLTFSGERHRIILRATGPDSSSLVKRMCDGLEEAEFAIPGVIVADIASETALILEPDGSTTFTIEALTVEED
jgi:hypothetical protein